MCICIDQAAPPVGDRHLQQPIASSSDAPHSQQLPSCGTNMKFGQQLRTSLIKDYYWHYIAYDDLKDALKTDYVAEPTDEDPKPKRKWSEDDEKAFIAQLEGELDKVFSFQRLKSEEIIRRIRASEKEVHQVIRQAEESGDESAFEDDFLLLEADLSDIIADVHDLAKYTQLNYTGFQKIIKKHDKQTDWHLKPSFATRLKAKPFFKDNYDAFIVTLSKLYDLVRTRGNPVKGDSSAGGNQQNFVRQTTKYWVHKDNITELKLIILKHLPVLVFNPNKEFEEKDSAISSIYYDNPETWELYMGRLKKTEGAEAIRLRWYGGMESEKIYLERKTHREDWTGEKSVKARFELKEKNVNAFLAGKMTVEQAFEKMRKDGKKGEKEIADLEQLAREIQYRVITRKLVPVTRSFYHRTAFQLPGDARVRISLDTELTMVREDNLDGRDRTGKNWRRMDIGVDYPFSQLPPEDVERFPYAVLEVKLQTQAGQEPPQWIRDLTASHLVEAVPKFSKFIHGTATMFPDRIHLLPFWMPQMDVDIRKPITHRFGIERPNTAPSVSTSDDPMDTDSEREDNDENETVTGQTTPKNFIEDEGQRRLRDAQQAIDTYERDRTREDDDTEPNELDYEERVAAMPLSQDPDDYPIYDSEEEDEADRMIAARERGGWVYRWRIFQKHVSIATDYLLSGLKKASPTPKPTAMPSNVGGLRALGGDVQARRFRAPKGKRIHVPVRVEPKVYFAAERTFLSWMEFSIILGSIAATLLNFGDQASLISAWGFTIVATLALLYSVGIYLVRVDMIRKRRASVSRYYDKWGPTLLCLMLLAAVAINFAFKIKEDGWFDGKGSSGQNATMAGMKEDL